ncbi:MAG TPA: NACHT domain-containing protein [Polyangia bacterium]|jgi:hypothetical protein|nr:NACHT domain-containing protein [Polyangia bacterium]
MNESREENVEEQRWWQQVPEGKPLLLGLVKIDRQGSTREWQELPADDVLRRRARYTAGVEQVARDFDAAQPLLWQGDGVMLCFARPGEPAAALARHVYRAARALWERVCLELNLPARIAVHAALVPWSTNTGTMAHPALDLCGHLEHAAPASSVVLSEDVYLALSVEERRELGALGSTIRDGMPAYVFPANAAGRRDETLFRGWDELALWDAFRRYAEGPDVRLLRYVGLGLQREEPPGLDVRDVFVMPQVEMRRGRGAEDLRSFEELFREHRSLVVLGEPGSGKTTLLRWLAMRAAGGALMLAALGGAERLLPVPVSMGRLAEVRRELGTATSMIDALARYFYGRNLGEEVTLRRFLQERLTARQCLVLLDGLDEVRSEEQRGMSSSIETFAAANTGNRFVVTSRCVGYAGLSLPDGEEVVLRPFDDDQLERYVRAFHRAYLHWESEVEDPAVAEKESERLLAALKGSPWLGILARHPGTLSALVLIHRPERRLPRHRVQAYERFAQALCETWGEARRLAAERGEEEAIDDEIEAISLLGELALRMHEQDPSGVASRAFVLRTLEKALVRQRALDKKEAGKMAANFLRWAGDDVQILSEHGPDQWGFTHLALQEFFAAAGLHAQEKFEREALQHLLDPRWEEVIRLGVGYLALVQKRPEAARRFIEKVLRAKAPEESPQIKRRLIMLADLLAAEAGNTLPQTLQKEISKKKTELLQSMSEKSKHSVGEPA